jgi:hypothetical protein
VGRQSAGPAASGSQAIQIGMREEQHQFLRLLNQLPARLTTEQAAWVLNCQPHDVPILVAARLLKPLGSPPPNSVKFFAALEVLEQAKDRTWLAKVTNALNQHWQRRNAAKQTCAGNGASNGHNCPVDRPQAAPASASKQMP